MKFCFVLLYIARYRWLQDDGDDGVSQEDWEQLLDAENPHRLMYSLQIVESLSRPPKFRRNSYDVSSLRCCVFVSANGVSQSISVSESINSLIFVTNKTQTHTHTHTHTHTPF